MKVTVTSLLVVLGVFKIGFSAPLAVFALYSRITTPETPRLTFDVAHDIEACYSHSPVPLGPTSLRTLANGATALCSLLLQHPSLFVDFAFYGLGLNNSTIVTILGYSSGTNICQILYNAAIGNLILVWCWRDTWVLAKYLD